MNQRLRPLFVALAFLCFAVTAPPLLRPARADLAAYLARPEPAYKWEKRGEKRLPGGTVYDLHLISQTWQGRNWEHRLQILRPDTVSHPDFCVLLNTGGSGNDRDTATALLVASAAQTVMAVVYDIPNQPLYKKSEDALVAHTWLKFLETGDESWPLHFPMAKSVLKAMDAIQAFGTKTGQPPVRRFLVTGASKRGWTAWLVGASRDPRVVAIAPMVIDTLNIAAQIPHQLAAFGGKPSEQVSDYTQTGLLEKLRSPQGKRLLELEDPYSYRDALTLPKLIILGTNDRYWAQDALNLYWDGLKGPKWVLYVPNSGHGLEDKTRVLATLSAFARAQAARRPWPKPTWEYRPTPNGGAALFVRSDVKPTSARLFRAHAPTPDFRDAKWIAEPMTEATGAATAGAFTGRLDRPGAGYAAVFGEVTYNLGSGPPFTLSTQIRILGGETKK